MKFVCAWLVVSIHISPLSTYFELNTITKYLNYGVTNYIARVAVPFYFAAAGFFLFRKIDFNHVDFSYLKKYVFKLLRLLGVWNVLLFVGRTDHLWYMSGLVIAVCVFSFFLYKKISFHMMIRIAAVLYVVGLLGDSYYGLLQPVQKNPFFDYALNIYYFLFETTRNGLFMGFPFLMMGGWIQKKNIVMKSRIALLGCILSLVALFVEAFLVKYLGLPKGVDLYIFLAPTIFFLLVFAVNTQIAQRTVFQKMRNCGIVVYFSHLFVYQWIIWGWKVIDRIFEIEINNSLLNYFLTIILSTVLGVLIDMLSKKKSLAFLKYLYS